LKYNEQQPHHISPFSVGVLCWKINSSYTNGFNQLKNDDDIVKEQKKRVV